MRMAWNPLSSGLIPSTTSSTLGLYSGHLYHCLDFPAAPTFLTKPALHTSPRVSAQLPREKEQVVQSQGLVLHPPWLTGSLRALLPGMPSSMGGQRQHHGLISESLLLLFYT